MKIGYGRVSTEDQNPELQVAALRKAGCRKIFVDRASGAAADRPELGKALAAIGKGDYFIVWKVDRLSRSLRDFLTIQDAIARKGAIFRTLTEAIDLGTPVGRMAAQVLSSFAELDRAMIGERTKSGLAAARARGVKLGRKFLLTGAQIDLAEQLLADEKQRRTVRQVAAALGTSISTLTRALRRRREQRIMVAIEGGGDGEGKKHGQGTPSGSDSAGGRGRKRRTAGRQFRGKRSRTSVKDRSRGRRRAPRN